MSVLLEGFKCLPPTPLRNLLATSMLGGEYSGSDLKSCFVHLPPVLTADLRDGTGRTTGLNGVLGVLGES
jgi:hypothetical protein